MNTGSKAEFYAPWRIAKRLRMAAIAELDYVAYDDNSNPMMYARDDYFIHEAVRRINTHDDLLATLERLVEAVAAAREAEETYYAIDRVMPPEYVTRAAQAAADATSKLTACENEARALIRKARGGHE